MHSYLQSPTHVLMRKEATLLSALMPFNALSETEQKQNLLRFIILRKVKCAESILMAFQACTVELGSTEPLFSAWRLCTIALAS